MHGKVRGHPELALGNLQLELRNGCGTDRELVRRISDQGPRLGYQLFGRSHQLYDLDKDVHEAMRLMTWSGGKPYGPPKAKRKGKKKPNAKAGS